VACSLAQTGLSILMGRVTTNLRTELNVCREVVAKNQALQGEDFTVILKQEEMGLVLKACEPSPACPSGYKWVKP
jgi:hypothetical protein